MAIFKVPLKLLYLDFSASGPYTVPAPGIQQGSVQNSALQYLVLYPLPQNICAGFQVRYTNTGNFLPMWYMEIFPLYSTETFHQEA